MAYFDRHGAHVPGKGIQYVHSFLCLFFAARFRVTDTSLFALLSFFAVGTSGSTYSLLAARRVVDWNQGIVTLEER